MSEPTIKSLQDSLEHWQANTMFARQEANSQRAERDALRERIVKLEAALQKIAQMSCDAGAVNYSIAIDTAYAAIKDAPQ